jgi:aminopeptidase-like protein
MSATRLSTIIFCLSITALARPARADVTQDPPEKVLNMMIEATKNRSFADFMAEASDQLRAELTVQNFEGVCGQLSPRLQKGYKTKYLTKLRKEDQMMVYLWKLEYADGKDDSLITMAVKNKKVAGILLQ